MRIDQMCPVVPRITDTWPERKDSLASKGLKRNCNGYMNRFVVLYN